MATPTRDHQAEILLKGANNLDVASRRAIGAALGIVERGIGDLEKKMADRATAITKAVSDYERALNSGSTSAKIDAFVQLRKLQLELPIKFADSAYAPNLALLDEVSKSIPPAFLAQGTLRDEQVARVAWETYLRSPRSRDANMLGTDAQMRSTYGDPPVSLVGAGTPLLTEYNSYNNSLVVAKQNAEQFNVQMGAMNRVAETFENFRKKNPDLDDNTAYAQFEKLNKSLLAEIPGPKATGVELLSTYMKNPAEHPEYFSDINASIAERQAAKDEYLGMMAVGEQPTTPQEDERAILAGWVRREDVQAWAKQHGFNLGRAEPVPAGSKLEADIKAGYYPQSVLVNGLLYSPSPDDMRAAKLAYNQMQMDPQKNILYNLGLAGDRTRRGMAEIEVSGGAPPNLVLMGSRKRTVDGKEREIFVGQLSDGTYAASEDAGENWTRMPEAGAQALVKDMTLEPVELEAPGIQAKTKKILIEERGSMYTDPMGSIRGVDRTPGSPTFNRPIVMEGSQIVRRTRLGEERYRKPLGETLGGITAAATEKRGGFAPVDTTAEWNKQDIGTAPTSEAKRERTTATREMAKLPAEPTAAVPEQVSALSDMTKTATVGEQARPTTLQGVPTVQGAEQTAVGATSGLLRPAPPPRAPSAPPPTVKTPSLEEIDTQSSGTTTSKPVTPSASVEPQRGAFAFRSRLSLPPTLP